MTNVVHCIFEVQYNNIPHSIIWSYSKLKTSKGQNVFAPPPHSKITGGGGGGGAAPLFLLFFPLTVAPKEETVVSGSSL